ncbi:PREDICTED: RING-box protein 1b-like [Drosophila arizonae]|uniref:RING-box protein 1b-like n=1 Tax=Drosophila arizonae TaxID=7263 RepID=A0ABM1PZ46_DROAR|nr:PREDICTED: RING-box protein 1b-like [Drosophila arizonae]
MKEFEKINNDATDEKSARFQIMNWNANAFWAWDIGVDTCAICRNHIDELCNECLSNMSVDCPKACGVCQHVYHYHCISRWLTKRHVCPLDYLAWQYKN